MSKELPVRLKSTRTRRARTKKTKHDLESTKICIIHFDRNKTDKTIKSLTQYSFGKITDVAKIRQESSDPNIRLDDIIQNIPHTYDSSCQGIHRWCYQTFTHVHQLEQRKRVHSTEGTANSNLGDASLSAKRRRRISSDSTASASALFPDDKCLFCGKGFIKVKQKRQRLVKCVTKSAENSIHTAAESKQDDDLLCRIRGMDLVAREAHYHNYCRREYTRKEGRYSSASDINALEMLDAHEKAFEYICCYVEENIIIGLKVERLTMIREKYLMYMLENSPDFYNENYKTYKLKDKLLKHFEQRIQFWQPSSRSDLVYSNDIYTGQAVEVAFELASSEERTIEEAAFITRRHIIDKQRTSTHMPWPPSATWLSLGERNTPPILQTFLSFVASGKPCKDVSARTDRFVRPCSQDICYAATNGKWALSKHILLAMTIRHLTGSSEIITILNRFGHCQSYSQTLELETAMCRDVTSRPLVLPSSISTESNTVLHLAWDNFDLNEETPSGAGTTHSTHGIVIQEQQAMNSVSNELTEFQVSKSHERTVQPVIEELQPCFVKAKVEPVLNVIDTSTTLVKDMSHVGFSDFLWMYCRMKNPVEKQSIPSWAGWLSMTGSEKSTDTGQACSVVETTCLQ